MSPLATNTEKRDVAQIYGLEKITGTAVFTFDMKLPGMLYAVLKRSTIPHGRIIRIDVTKAKALPGVVAVITGNDVPPGLHGRGLLDTPILTREHVRYVGEPIAAVAAESYEKALDAVEMIEVEYEELPAVFDPEESMAENPPAIIHPDLHKYKRLSSKLYKVKTHPTRPNVSAYQQIVYGDVERAFNNADLIIDGVYETVPVQHVQLEPTSIIAQMDAEGNLTVITSGQTPFRTRRELSDSLGIPESKIRIIVPKHVGGGFGNRGAAVYEPICAALAMKTNGRPVKLVLTRMEDLAYTTTRHATKIYIRDAVLKDGRIIGRRLKIIYDGGAYSVAGNVAVRNAIYAVSSVYKIPNVYAEIYRVYTNKPQGGAFRGFGSTQVYWAIESQMDEIAEKLGIHPIDVRRINLLRDGDESCIGEIMHEDTTDLCLEQFSHLIEKHAIPSFSDENGVWKIGRGIAIAKHQCDVTYPNIALVKVNEDFSVDVYVGSTDVGQGTFTGLAQIAALELGADIDKVRIIPSDTLITPTATGSSGSRQLVQMGMAVSMACKDAKSKIVRVASTRLGVPESRLKISNGVIYDEENPEVQIHLRELFSPGPMGGDFLEGEGVIMGKGVFYEDVAEIDPDTGRASRTNVALDYTPVCACADVAVNMETGEVRVINLFLVTDVGKAINRALVEGQIIGGAMMGVSTSLLEHLVIENGQPLNPTLMDYLVAGSMESPNIEHYVIESGKGPGPMGARSIGEIPILPIAPAIGNAVKNAVGIRLHRLPISAEDILSSLRKG